VEDVREIDIIITLVAGTLLMLLMATVVIISVIKYQQRVLKQNEMLQQAEQKFQNELLEAMILAAEDERQTIAKNMHDDVGMLLNVIKLNHRQLKNKIGEAETSLQLINTNNQLLTEIVENVQNISAGLKNSTLARLGFGRAFYELCDKVNESGSVKVSVEPGEWTTRFSAKVELQLFRICKEVLNNILKHSGATAVAINLNFVPDLLSVSVTYNGNGINDEEARARMQTGKGLGLKSIYSRVQILEAKLNYIIQSPGKCSVLLQVPAEAKQENEIQN
jgi:two-component system, NarL family, sensor kinase